MLKVVLDTNQFVSGLLVAEGPSAHIIDLWRDHKFILAASDHILEEIRRVLKYPHITKKYKLDAKKVSNLLTLLEQEAVIVDASGTLNIIKEDPDDNRILLCAVKSHADYIVSGDKLLLALGAYQGIKIMRPTDFLRVIKT